MTFTLFDVCPDDNGEANEILHLLAGLSEKEGEWWMSDLVEILLPRFSGDFAIKGVSGAFLGSTRVKMAEAVIDAHVGAGYSSLADSTMYFSGKGAGIEKGPADSLAVLMQGFAYEGDFVQLSTRIEARTRQKMSLADILLWARKKTGFTGDYLAFTFQVVGTCTVRAARSHPQSLVTSHELFGNYAHVTTDGLFCFYGIATPSAYSSGGHAHGYSLTSPNGGHFVSVEEGSLVIMQIRQPTFDEIIPVRY